jgi:adenosylhomocysteine nucleosidase
MGAAAAAKAARALVDAGASSLMSWGMAGGLDPSLAPGAIVLPDEIVSVDGTVHPTAAPWRQRLTGAIEQPSIAGRLLTSRTAVGSREDKAALFRETGAVAVDMESLAIAEVAQSSALPFVAIRVIVDTAEDSLPRAVTAAADNEGHLRIGRLLGALARSPGELGSLLRLQKRYRIANQSLAAVAKLWL